MTHATIRYPQYNPDHAELIHLSVTRYGLNFAACWPPEQDAHTPAHRLAFRTSDVDCPECRTRITPT